MARSLRLIFRELDDRKRPILNAYLDTTSGEVVVREYDHHPFGLSVVSTETTLAADLVSAIKALP